MARLTLDSPIWLIVVNLIVYGIGNGFFQSPNNSSVMGSVPKNRLGIASSFLATMRNAGMVMGIAIGGAIFSNLTKYYMSHLSLTGQTLENTAFMNALSIAYVVGTAIDMLCAITSAVRGKHSQYQTE
jgi:MFS family permease